MAEERPAPSEARPGTSDTRPEAGEGPPEAEPEIPGTLFLTTLLLVMIFGFWVLMYWTLLHR